MSSDLISQSHGRQEGKLATYARKANGALSTGGSQSKWVLLVPALKERRLAIPALRSEDDGSACT
jgi:hypothetical protein